MTRNVTLTAFGLLATLAASSLTPVLADGQRDRQQTNKNNARNIAIAGAAVAVYGLLSHNNTATLVGAAAGALGGSQYEKDRKQQSQDNNGRGYYRNGNGDRNDYSGNYNTSSRNDNRDWNRNNSDQNRDASGWSQGRGRTWDSGSGNDNNRQWDGASYHRQGSRDNQQWNRDYQTNNSNRDCDQETGDRRNGDSRTHSR